MLLRRITEHVKAQNWTAVALDFIIVVVGVFMGLQVQQWAEERVRRGEEALYTQRLHDEVVDLQATRTPIIEMRAQWVLRAREAHPVIYGDTDRPLSEDECRGIAYNYFVSNPTDDLGALLELQSSGRLSIIRNDVVTQALQKFLLTRARARDSQAQISALVEPIGPAHPHLIRVVSPTVVDNKTEVTSAAFECDAPGMREDEAFKQDFEIAQSHAAFHMFDNARVSDSLDALHSALDDVLGINHEGPE